MKEDEINQVKTEAVRVNKMRDQTVKKIKQLDDAKAEVRVCGWVVCACFVCIDWCLYMRGHV